MYENMLRKLQVYTIFYSFCAFSFKVTIFKASQKVKYVKLLCRTTSISPPSLLPYRECHSSVSLLSAAVTVSGDDALWGAAFDLVGEKKHSFCTQSVPVSLTMDLTTGNL